MENVRVREGVQKTKQPLSACGPLYKPRYGDPRPDYRHMGWWGFKTKSFWSL